MSSNKMHPIHPGEILKKEFMEPFGLSSNALARAIGVTPTRINDIVRERRGITAETALRLAKYFGTDTQSWMNLQDQYELSIAEQSAKDSLEQIRPIAATG
ncbi:Antitoxin HigA [hydrothermal vent metagenome]|uniref:Antitoxin HigA n=1 Tax=hydrothermal vent metagenome TaxID=652676 RepID=A0A3B1BT94_9ZZZZ